MRILAWSLWTITVIWLVLSVVGALNFQELYGGSSGAQVLAVTVLIGAIPALIGWWAYRRSRARDG